MSKILLRVANRLTAVEVDADQFYRTEFCRGGRPDLELSVYDVEDNQESLCRIIAEHHAIAPDQERPRTKRHFHVSGLEPRAPQPNPLPGPFTFLRDAHGEIRFEDEGELRALAMGVHGELAERGRTIERPAVREFLTGVLRVGNPEWRAFLESTPTWQAWVEPVE